MACVYWIHHPDHIDILTQGYIGFTSMTPSKRWNSHKSHANKKNPLNTPLHKAIRKYKTELIFKVLFIGGIDYCLDIEKKLRPDFKIGWNLAPGGDKPSIGRKSTNAERAHFSKIFKGRRHTEEHKKKVSEFHKGKKHRLGHSPSIETRKKNWRLA